MAELPKLKVLLPPWFPEREVICEIEREEVNKLIHTIGMLVVAGQVISSYEELTKLVAHGGYDDEEVLEAGVLSPIAGG